MVATLGGIVVYGAIQFFNLSTHLKKNSQLIGLMTIASKRFLQIEILRTKRKMWIVIILLLLFFVAHAYYNYVSWIRRGKSLASFLDNKDASEPLAAAVIMIFLGALFCFVWFVFWVVTRSTPMIWYFLTSLVAVIVTTFLPRKSLWTEPLRIVAISSCLGLLILTTFKFIYVPTSGEPYLLGGAERVHAYHMTLISFRENIEKYGILAWIVFAISIVVSILIGWATASSKVLNRVLWIQRAYKIFIGTIVFASSLSLFATNSVTGEMLTTIDKAIQEQLSISRNREELSRIQAIKINAETLVLRGMPANQKLYLNYLVNEVSMLPKLGANDRDRIIDLVLNNPPSPKNTAQSESTHFRSKSIPADVKHDAVNVLNDQEHAEGEALKDLNEAESNYQEVERDAISDVLASAVDQPTKGLKKAVTEELVNHVKHALGTLLTLDDSFVSFAFEGVVDIVSEVGMKQAATRVVNLIADRLKQRANWTTVTHTSMRNEIHVKVREAVRDIANQYAQNIKFWNKKIQYARSILKDPKKNKDLQALDSISEVMDGYFVLMNGGPYENSLKAFLATNIELDSISGSERDRDILTSQTILENIETLRQDLQSANNEYQPLKKKAQEIKRAEVRNAQDALDEMEVRSRGLKR